MHFDDYAVTGSADKDATFWQGIHGARDAPHAPELQGANGTCRIFRVAVTKELNHARPALTPGGARRRGAYMYNYAHYFRVTAPEDATNQLGESAAYSGGHRNEIAQFKQIRVGIREAKLILVDNVHPGPRDAEKALDALLSILDRNDVVEAVNRLEAGWDAAV